MTPTSAKDADPQFSRAMLVAALVEGAFIAAGLAAYFLTGNIVLLFAIAIVGMGLFGLLFWRAWNQASARKAADAIVRDGGPL